MKTWICIGLLFFSMSSQAQTFSEWFRQKKTQKKYLMQQIVALKVYAGYLKDGYAIASKGIHSIESFTNGEFGLHEAFFNSLKVVSPLIANHEKVDDILTWQDEIKKGFSAFFKRTLPVQRKEYVEQVKDKLLSECDLDMEELLQLISSGELELSDDERLKRLTKIHDRMKDKYEFTQVFINQVNVLEKQMEMEKRNLQRIKEHYQISNEQ